MRECYPFYTLIKITDFEKRCLFDDNYIYDSLNHVKYWTLLYNKAKKLLKKDICVRNSNKLVPLLLETKNYFVFIAPLCCESKFDFRNGFVELTGCKCKIHLDNEFDKNGVRIKHEL